MDFVTDPNDPRLNKPDKEGMNEVYLVISEEERKKGFVRPVRTSYTHVRCGNTTSMGLPLAETYARDPRFYNATYCAACKSHFALVIDGEPQFVWSKDGQPVGS